MRSIYFDANIYSYASRDAQVDHLRSWLDRKGWSAVASILNLIELARTGDRAQALAFVGALTRITRNHEDPPFTVLLADEFLEEVKRHRPNWGRACGWKGRAERLVSYRKTWNAVRASPEEALVRLTDFRGHHAPLEQGLHEQQAQVAEWLRDRGVTAVEVVVSSTLRRLVGDQLADRVDRLPAAERFVRLSALEDWVAALLANGSAPNDLRDWVDGHLNSVDEPALAEFWLSDVRLDVVARHPFVGWFVIF